MKTSILRKAKKNAAQHRLTQIALFSTNFNNLETN